MPLYIESKFFKILSRLPKLFPPIPASSDRRYAAEVMKVLAYEDTAFRIDVRVAPMEQNKRATLHIHNLKCFTVRGGVEGEAEVAAFWYAAYVNPVVQVGVFQHNSERRFGIPPLERAERTYIFIRT